MSQRVIVNQWAGDTFPTQDVEVGGGDYLVETSGYVPKETQLLNLQTAGAALEAYLKSTYPGNSPPEDYDPTTSFDYDFFDWHSDVVFVRNQLTELQRLSNDTSRHTPAEFISAQTEPPPPEAS